MSRAKLIGVTVLVIVVVAAVAVLVLSHAVSVLEDLAAAGWDAAFHRLVSLARDGNDSAMLALGRLHDPRAFDALVEALKSPDPSVAIEALAMIGAPACEALVGVLGDPDESVRASATLAITRIGRPAIGPVSEALHEQNLVTRQAAASVLKKLRWNPPTASDEAAYAVALQDWDKAVEVGPPSVEPLVAQLQHNDGNTRCGVLWALARIKDPRAVGAVSSALSHSALDTRECAVLALCQMGAPAFDSLLGALRNSSDTVRKNAVECLGRTGDARVVEPLIACLRDSSFGVREVAAEFLGTIGDVRAVEPLIACGHSTPNALLALRQIDDPLAVEPLVGVLRCDILHVPALRDAAADVLVKIGRPSVKPLIGNLQDDDCCYIAAATLIRIGGQSVDSLALALEDPGLRDCASDVLAQIGTPACIRLEAALEHEQLRPAAAAALVKIAQRNEMQARDAAGDALVRSLGHKDDAVVHAAIDSLRELGHLPALLSVVYHRTPAVEDAALTAIAQAGDATLPWLIAELNNPDLARKHRAIKVLRRLSTPAIIDRLIVEASSNISAHRRENACWALGKIGDARATNALIGALHDAERGVRLNAIEGLGGLQDARAVGPLVEMIRADKERWFAIQALAKTGEPGVEGATSLLRSDDAKLRCAAIEVLQKSGEASAVELLIKALQDPEHEVRDRAARVMGAFPDARAVGPLIAILDRDAWTISNSTVTALAGIGAPAVESLSKALQNENPRVRWRAALALGRIGDVRATEALIAALYDTESRVRHYAAQALGEIRDPRAIVPLIALLAEEDPDLQAYTAGALGQLQDSRATEALCKLVKREEAPARRAAARALGLIADPHAAEALSTALADWDVGPVAVSALDTIGWTPEIPTDWVHYTLARRQKEALLGEWQLTRKVLMTDVESGSVVRVRNALYGFIGLGREAVVPDLINALHRCDNKAVAETYVNCGHEPLEAAARQWARVRGYTISSSGGIAATGWGKL